MLQITERYFDSPPPVVDIFDVVFVKGKGKIGNDVLVGVFSCLDLQNTKLQIAKMVAIQ